MALDTHRVPDASLINDVRTPASFKGITFSKYKKLEVKHALLDNMMKIKIEPACYWCAELICAGHYTDIWDILLHFLGKHVHLGNPKLTVYMENRYQIFRNIMSQSFFTHDIQARNNQSIRKLFFELICVFAYSPRKHSFEPIKINRTEEFDVTQMTEKLHAPSIKYGQPLLQKDDPKELFIAINEFAYHITREGVNAMRACYWIEWLMEFDAICKKRKTICRCERRAYIPVESKYQKDTIWLIWDTLNHYAKEEGHNEFVQKTLASLLRLFCIKYTTGSCKKRRYLLYFAVGLLVDTVPTTVEIIGADHKKILVAVLGQIDVIYKQIKRNEESPNTDYLFNNLNDAQRNLEATMKKIELMQTMDRAKPGKTPRTYDDDDDGDLFS